MTFVARKVLIYLSFHIRFCACRGAVLAVREILGLVVAADRKRHEFHEVEAQDRVEPRQAPRRLRHRLVRSRSTVSIALICTISPQIPASARTNQGPEIGDLILM